MIPGLVTEASWRGSGTRQLLLIFATHFALKMREVMVCISVPFIVMKNTVWYTYTIRFISTIKKNCTKASNSVSIIISLSVYPLTIQLLASFM